MTRVDIKCLIDYMYKEEMRSYEEYVLDRDLLPESELVNGQVPIVKLAEMARNEAGHIFGPVQRMADFYDNYPPVLDGGYSALASLMEIHEGDDQEDQMLKDIEAALNGAPQ